MTGPEPAPARRGHPGDDTAPEAVARPRRLSWVWLIPLGSVLIAGWLLWSNFRREGPLIDITFDNAEGLKAGQSPLEFKDIQMGTVESFALTHDRKRVIMHVRMTNEARDLLTEGAEFWVVKPRIFAGDISGLNTLISGPHLNMRPGRPGASQRRHFDGLEDPPQDPEQPGRIFHLVGSQVGSVSVGSPLIFHTLTIGRVLSHKISDMARKVDITAFVEAPYDAWVHDNSSFWDTSGLDVELGADGIKLQMQSVKAVLLGAITLDTPDDGGVESQAGHVFRFYDGKKLAEAASAPNRTALVSYFTGSVGGLAVGAPVTLQGSPVGVVTSVDLQYDSSKDQPRVRASFAVDVAKVQVIGSQPRPPYPQNWERLVASGLRAKLVGGNLITGQKEIELAIEPNAPPAAIGREGDSIVMPTDSASGGGLDELSGAANELLAKIGSIPFADIGRHLDSTLAGADRTTNDPQVIQTVHHLNTTLAEAQATVSRVDAGMRPAMQRLPMVAADLQESVAHLRSLTGSVANGTAGDSKLGRDLDETLLQLNDALSSIRTVADLLGRHPEALIRGRVMSKER